MHQALALLCSASTSLTNSSARRRLPPISPPGMLHAHLLLSDHAHARILSVDTRAAEQVPGVIAVLSANNTPIPLWQRISRPGAVCPAQSATSGEVIAAVAAQDAATAAEAVRCITVQYEPLPAVVDVLDAIRPEAPIVHEDLASYPGVNPAHCWQYLLPHLRGLGQCRGRLCPGRPPLRTHVPHQHRASGLSRAHGDCRPGEPNGKVTVWTSTQSTYVVRARLAHLFDLPFTQVRVIVPHVGGGFGGKLQTAIEPYCVLLSRRTRRPVKLVLSRQEEFFLGKPRSASAITIKTGVTNAGRLTARQATLYFDTGFSCHPRSVQIGPQVIRGPYNIPHVRFDGVCVYTNKMGCGSFRGPGGIQAHFASESQIDIICRDLGIDPVEFRRRNGVKMGDISAAGVALRQVGMQAALEAAAQHAGWSAPKAGVKRGRGIACAEWRLGGGRGSGAWVKLNEDGTVVLNAGITEIGSGSSTALVQMAAEVLGVRPERVALVSGDTETTPTIR